LSITGLYSGVLAVFNPLEAVVGKPLFTFSVGSWQVSVSNHMFMVSIAAVILLIVIPAAIRQNHNNMAPRGMRNLLESICVFFKKEVAGPILKGHTDQYIGFIWTVFFFILTLNLLGLVPTEKVVALLTGKENHFGGAATANIWITGAMAAIAFFMMHLVGIKEQGLWRYIANFAPPAPWWIVWFLFLLELLSSFVRPFTLAIRLFANMLAGHMVLATFLGLILVFRNYGVAGACVLMAVALSVMEILVAFIQAYIFAFLCTLYIGFSIESEH
jgi:F-type H+-transporting ATPase subunit a